MAHSLANLWNRWISRRGMTPSDLGHSAGEILADIDAGRAIPQDIVDALLDDEASATLRSAYFAVLRAQPTTQAELDDSEMAIDALRDAPHTPAPDLAGRILSEVDRRKGLLDRRALRRVSLARWSVAACLVLSAAGFFTLRRAAPEATNLLPTPAPLRDLARSLPAEANGALISARSALELVRFTQSALASAEQACAKRSDSTCDPRCRISRCSVVTAPVTDHGLVLASWLESVEEFAAFARIPAPRRSVVATMPAAWSPGSTRVQNEPPTISLRTLLTEPSQTPSDSLGAASETLDRLLPEPRR